MDGVAYPGVVAMEVAGAIAENNRCITSLDGPQTADIIRGITQSLEKNHFG